MTWYTLTNKKKQKNEKENSYIYANFTRINCIIQRNERTSGKR